MLLDFQAGSAAGIHNPRLGYNRMRKQGERGGAELRLAISYKQYPTVRTRERPPVRVPCAIYENRLTSAKG